MADKQKQSPKTGWGEDTLHNRVLIDHLLLKLKDATHCLSCYQGFLQNTKREIHSDQK